MRITISEAEYNKMTAIGLKKQNLIIFYFLNKKKLTVIRSQRGLSLPSMPNYREEQNQHVKLRS